MTDDVAPRGLTLTERQRRLIANRLMLQLPKGLSLASLAEARHALDRKVEGLPGDVVLALGSVLLLAEQGNRVAAKLFVDECVRLGIEWRPARSFPGAHTAIVRR